MKNARPAEAVPSAKTRAHSTPQASLPGMERASEAPIMPRPNTRPAEALALLVARPHVDQRDFLDAHGGWRLAAAVFELRALGWPIVTEHVPVVLDNGEASHIARYRLDRAGPALAMQRGYLRPELLVWFAITAPVLAVGLAIVSRWFA